MIKRFLLAPLIIGSLVAVAQAQVQGGDAPIASTTTAGKVKCDGTTTSCAADGTITATAGGTAGINQLTGDVTAGPSSGSAAATVAKIGGKTVTLGGNLVTGGAFTTTGTGGIIFALPNVTATYTFPSATKTLMASDYSNATTLTTNALLTGGGIGQPPNAVAITGLVKGNGASAPTAAAAGTDYLTPSGSAANLTGLPLTTGVTGILPGANGGMGVANTGKTLTLGATSTSLPAAPASTQCLHEDNTGAITTTGSDCGGGGGGSGFGVDGGTNAQSVTGTATINNNARLVKIASGWATGTLTLPAISSVSADSAICVDDGGQFVGAGATLTVAANGADGIGGGGFGGTVGPFTGSGIEVCFRVSATHNWTMTQAVALSSAPSHQFATGLTANGLTYGQPGFGDVSGFLNLQTQVTGVLPSANGGLGLNNGSNTLALNAPSTSLPAAPASTQCLHMATSGAITPTGSDCGAGGGSSPTVTDGVTSITTPTTISFPSGFSVSGTNGATATVTPTLAYDDCTSGTCATSGSAAISTSDASVFIKLGAHTYTLAQAGTTGFASGWGPAAMLCTAGPCVITATTSTFAPASASTTLTLQTGDMAFTASDGTNYPTSIAHAAGMLLTQTGQVFTGGIHPTAFSNGTASSGTKTIDCGNGPIQSLTNGGAFTFAMSANDGECTVRVTNNASAGSITFSGFSEGSNTGDALDTTNTHVFDLVLTRIGGNPHYLVTALQ